jgi:hypothetical protein
MKPRFRADNDLDHDIVRALLRRHPDIDFKLDPLHNVDDDEVLALALSEGRLLVTHDLTTIPPLYQSLRAKRELPGVFLYPQRKPITLAVEHLELVWQLTEADQWQNRLIYLPTLHDFDL